MLHVRALLGAQDRFADGCEVPYTAGCSWAPFGVCCSCQIQARGDRCCNPRGCYDDEEDVLGSSAQAVQEGLERCA